MAPKDPVTGVGQEEALKAINSGDTAWMLASAALVLLMTPGVAFFYGELVANPSPTTPRCCGPLYIHARPPVLAGVLHQAD